MQCYALTNDFWQLVCGGVRCSVISAVYALPRRASPDDRYKLELVASEPEIVTPIGMAFDRQGRLLVIESHTHERPEEYQGPHGDRIRMLADSDGDGRSSTAGARSPRAFATR